MEFLLLFGNRIFYLNLVSITTEIKKYRTIIFPVVLDGREKLISHTQGGA
jgi:hypothetical protein